MQTKQQDTSQFTIQGDFIPGGSFKEKEAAFGALRLRFANLEAPDIIALSTRLINAQEKLKSESVFKIVDWIDQAALRWSKPEDPIRKEAEACIPLAGGISKEMLRFVLDDLSNNLRRPVLLKLLEEELGETSRLDQFCPKKKGTGLTKAFGPQLITQIVPANVGTLSITSLICGLLVKSANLIRTGPKDSLLPVLFARTLQEAWPEMAKAIGIVTWDKHEEHLTEAAFQNADCAIVYGSDETQSILAKKIPIRTKVIRYGHRFSLGIVARESIHKALADQAALDIALFDQRGCLSPQLYYVESGGTNRPLDFAKWLAQSLDAVSLRLPKGMMTPEEAVEIQQIRAALPLKGGKVFASPAGLDWTVLFDPDPAFSCSPLSRSIWIKSLEDLSEVPRLIAAHRQSLQALGFALPEARQAALIPILAEIGGSRICPIGQMQRPPMTWHHDGSYRLLPLLRFVDWEKA